MLDITQAAQAFINDLLWVRLAYIDDVVYRLSTAKMWMLRSAASGGRRPDLSGRIKQLIKEILVEKAKGIVTVRNMAGPVQVWSSAGVRCDSGSGGIHVSNISGPMRVSTSMGSILADLLGSQLADSSLATGNGDITVLIPSNLSVTVQAQDNQKIVSEFRELTPRRQGPRVVAEGSLNGGGPLLQISGMGGTIFLKRQQ